MLELINNRELGFMEILSIGMKLFTKNLKAIMIVVAFIFFPISILNELIWVKINDSLMVLNDVMKGEVISQNLPLYNQAFGMLLRNYLLDIIVMLFLAPVGVIAIAKITKSDLCNENMKVRDAIGEAMSCLWGLIVTGIICYGLVFIGSLFFLIPGLYLGIIWTFYEYIIGFRGIKGWKALEYSKKLIQGRFWKTFGFLIMINLIAVGSYLLIDAVFFLAPEHIVVEILLSTLAYIPTCFVCIGMAVLFMNRDAIVNGRKYYPVENVIDSTIEED